MNFVQKLAACYPSSEVKTFLEINLMKANFFLSFGWKNFFEKSIFRSFNLNDLKLAVWSDMSLDISVDSRFW